MFIVGTGRRGLLQDLNGNRFVLFHRRIVQGNNPKTLHSDLPLHVEEVASEIKPILAELVLQTVVPTPGCRSPNRQRDIAYCFRKIGSTDLQVEDKGIAGFRQGCQGGLGKEKNGSCRHVIVVHRKGCRTGRTNRIPRCVLERHRNLAMRLKGRIRNGRNRVGFRGGIGLKGERLQPFTARSQKISCRVVFNHQGDNKARCRCRCGLKGKLCACAFGNGGRTGRDGNNG